MAETIAELRALSMEDLIRRHDANAQSTVVGTQHYLNEIARRDASAQGDRMERMTQSMERLTKIITWLTVVNTLAAIVGAAVALGVFG